MNEVSALDIANNWSFYSNKEIDNSINNGGVFKLFSGQSCIAAIIYSSKGKGHYNVSVFKNNAWQFLTTPESGYPLNDTCRINDLLFDRKGKIWISTSNGILNYNGDKKWKQFPLDNPEVGYKWEYGNMTCDSVGRIWFFKQKLKIYTDYSHVIKNELYKIDGDNSSLFYTDSTFNFLISNGSICTTPSGDVWFCSVQPHKSQGVLYQVVSDSIHILNLESVSDSPYQRRPAWISSDTQNNIWITYKQTMNNFSGLSKFDGSSWEHWVEPGRQYFPFGYSGEYFSHLVDYNGTKWVCGGFGIVKIIDGVESYIKPSRDILFESHDSDFYAPYDRVNSAVIDSKGRIWFATGAGILVFDEPATTINEFGKQTESVNCYPNPLSNNQILNIVCDSYNDFDLFITDVVGVRVQLDNYTQHPIDRGNKISVALDGISPGLYFIGIYDGNKKQVLPVLIK
jgi:streptogramin lyase